MKQMQETTKIDTSFIESLVFGFIMCKQNIEVSEDNLFKKRKHNILDYLR